MVDQAGVSDERSNERDRLTKAQLELVLRRAAELEKSGGQASDELVSPEEIERIGAEAGLSPEALQRALAEVRSGALVPVVPPPPPTVLDRTIGPTRIIVERVVPGPIDDVRRRLEGFLKDQLLEIRRNYGDRIVWRRAEGFWPGVMRAFDFHHQFALSKGIEVESSVAAVDDRARIRIALDCVPLRRNRAAAATTGAVVGTALTVGAFFMIPGHLPLELLVAAGGGATAVGSVVGSRNAYRRDLDRMRDVLERFLDDVEHGTVR
jgi:hypothetical protein